MKLLTWNLFIFWINYIVSTFFLSDLSNLFTVLRKLSIVLFIKLMTEDFLLNAAGLIDTLYKRNYHVTSEDKDKDMTIVIMTTVIQRIAAQVT